MLIASLRPNVTLRWNLTGITVAGTMGVCGQTAAYLCSPHGLSFDPLSNALYIADNSNHRIQKWVLGATYGTTVAGNGTRGSSPNQLSYPTHAIVDADGNVYVSDVMNHRIQLWPNGASSGVTFAGPDFPGSSDTLLLNPLYITRDSNSGALYVTAGDRVIRWLPNDTKGTIVAGGNGPGTTPTQLYSASGLYFDSPSNSLYIGDSYAHIIVRWPLGASTWTLVAGALTGMCGYPPAGLCMPSAITLDPMDNLYVADGNGRIQ
ncbi:unnamed protein product [Rotaria sp. Silwood2]|nr:unnamed protein product [Rotaria sp. Silwood2]CAF4487162.1 unnamed protein product [Rotaria sp. Silwood2]